MYISKCKGGDCLQISPTDPKYISANTVQKAIKNRDLLGILMLTFSCRSFGYSLYNQAQRYVRPSVVADVIEKTRTLTNSMAPSPSKEAASCSATQGLSNILLNLKVQYRVHWSYSKTDERSPYHQILYSKIRFNIITYAQSVSRQLLDKHVPVNT